MKQSQQIAVRVAVFAGCLVPFLLLVWGAVTGSLGPDPAEAIMHSTGEWSLRLLVATLLISPLRHYLKWPVLLKLRRMLGLYVFFYAMIHLVSFAHFYVGWTGAILLEELIERPYITAGFVAWLIMVPLTVTSTRNMQRRLGRSWMRLHQLVYLAVLLACLHLLWQARSDITEAAVYAGIVTILLGWRVTRWWSRRSPSVVVSAGRA
ncbi:MAG: protein-methionine-sulfoxide reductase heme-binding subunit MsrQ [Halioglobus sp.]